MKLLLTSLGIVLLYTHSFGISFNQNTKPQNKEKIESIIANVYHLRDSSFDASIELGKKAIKLAAKEESSELLSKAYKALGVTYHYKGTFDSAEYYYREAIKHFKITGDSIQIGRTTGNIGVIYRRLCLYDKALEYYFEANKYHKATGYNEGIAGSFLNIGGVYHKLGNLDAALEYYIKSRDYFKKTKNHKKLARALTNIGVVEMDLGKYEEAIKTFNKTLRLNEKEGAIQNKAIILLNLGNAYEFLKQNETALYYYTECENLRLQLNDIWGLGKVFTSKAKLYSQLKKDSLAEAYFKKAEQSNKENKLQEDLAATYLHYSNFLESQNSTQEALVYYKKFINLKDSLDRISLKQEVAELTAKFESEQNAKELELLQQRTKIQKLELGQKNAWIITLLVILILGIVAVFVSLRINRLRADHKIMDLRQKVLLTQMNPHFLFNSLTAIQSFILDEKNNEANTYLSRLASLVRGILENSREEFVSLRTELSILKDYISMQKLRFDNDIAYNFNVGDNIDIDQVIIPPMLAQPFIENALIHGKLRNNPEAEIKVNISLLKNDLLQFEILDNGIGVDEARKQMKEQSHKSLATTIALDRVKIYNFKSSKKMNFEIIDLKQIDKKLHGTKVTYTIPLQSIDD